MQELWRRAPERIVLGVRPGLAPSGKPPVRIFLGSEASQFRPERVLAWSIEQVRDPARVYEIHLMKEIAGFDRREWTTGFTNYRLGYASAISYVFFALILVFTLVRLLPARKEA